MKFKSKIVLFVCAFALIFSVLSVSCFAFVPFVYEGKTYTFHSHPLLIDDSGDYLSFDVSGEFFILIDGIEYSSFIVENGVISFSSDSAYFTYNDSAGLWTYTDSNGYSENVSPPIFTITFIESSIDYRFISWISGNVDLYEDNSFYSNLFTSISDGVFGVGAVLTPEQVMTLTLISTILSYAFILLPLLLVIGFVLRCFRL